MWIDIDDYRNIFCDVVNFINRNNLSPKSYVNVRRESDKSLCYRRITGIGFVQKDGFEVYQISSILGEIESCYHLQTVRSNFPTDFNKFVNCLGFDLNSFAETHCDDHEGTRVQKALDMYEAYRKGILNFNELMIIDTSKVPIKDGFLGCFLGFELEPYQL